jgi:Phage integrase, N-terminal SAM-like domain
MHVPLALLAWLALLVTLLSWIGGDRRLRVIRKRGARWQVRVYVGRDLLTGRKRYTTATVSTRAEATRLEARLVTEIDQGRHRAAGSKTVGELVERWLEWRQSVKPISPTTLAGYRGYIDRTILPALGTVPLRRLDAATLDTIYARLRQTGGQGRPGDGRLQRPPGPRDPVGRAQARGGAGLDLAEPARLAVPPSIHSSRRRTARPLS